VTPTPIIILGTGGNSIDLLDTLDDINRRGGTERYRCVGFLDDNPARKGDDIHGARILGPLASALDIGRGCRFVSGIGSPASFLHKPAILAATGIPDNLFETIVHPTASVSRLATLGAGSVIFQNSTVTSNVRIGRQVVVLPNTVISHDAVVGDYTCIAGGVAISGGVVIGDTSYVGTGSSIIGGVTIGRQCLIGMGSVVLRNVGENCVVAGNPARKIRNTY
jgi:sugar O-acyltransferase (sialic acid O-acetyltransferase NeuD family)